MRSTGSFSPRTRLRARRLESSSRTRPRASRSSWWPGFPSAMPKKPESHIGECTKRYEAWLASLIPLIEEDVRLKHAQMKAALFPFMRATFYRWAEIWPEACSDLCSATEALSVGDLHVENFGTWRDTDGRLIWGVNDFDEAAWLPYTNDLTRLVASANMAIDADHIALNRKDACG